MSAIGRLEEEGRIDYARPGFPRLKRYLDEMPGVPVQDIWADSKLYFRTPGGERLETVIVSVKGGNQLNPGMIRDLESVVRRERAAMGVFVSLEDPTSGMRQEANKYGFYEYGRSRFPVIQLITVEELLAGQHPQIPAGAANVSLEPRQARSLKTDTRTKDMPGLFDVLHRGADTAE